MSDISQLEQGKITLQQFIEKVAAEFKASPFAFLAPLALQLLQITLSVTLKSPTMAALIVADIQSVMSGNVSALASQVEVGSVALVSGLVSGQTGNKTGAAVVTALTGVAPNAVAAAPSTPG